MDGAGGEHGVEVAAGVDFGVGLDGGHADDARPGLVQGDQLERCVSGVELSGPVVVVRQHQVGVQACTWVAPWMSDSGVRTGLSYAAAAASAYSAAQLYWRDWANGQVGAGQSPAVVAVSAGAGRGCRGSVHL